MATIEIAEIAEMVVAVVVEEEGEGEVVGVVVFAHYDSGLTPWQDENRRTRR